MSKIVLIVPVVKPPKCKDCKWSVKLDNNVSICTTFKVRPASIKFEPLFSEDNVYLLDTEIARGDNQFCGYYGTHFEQKEN